MDCLRGCLATLSVLVVIIALLEYSKIHEKAYKCIVCEFGGLQNVLRDAYGTPSGTKISKRKRQQIVSESSFDVAIDYDYGLFFSIS